MILASVANFDNKHNRNESDRVLDEENGTDLNWPIQLTAFVFSVYPRFCRTNFLVGTPHASWFRVPAV